MGAQTQSSHDYWPLESTFLSVAQQKIGIKTLFGMEPWRKEMDISDFIFLHCVH